MKFILIPCAAILISFCFSITAPRSFPAEHIVYVKQDMSVGEVAYMLKEQGLIRSIPLFKLFARNIKASGYFFEEKTNLFGVISRLKSGESKIPYVRITIPEGSNNEQIAGIIWGKLADFDAPQFLRKYGKEQGYLFPDTYLFPVNFNEDKVVSLLKGTFERKVGKVAPDIIKMAAIVEEEGKSATDRKMIADILWRRLSIGMPLQVDVAMETYQKKGFPLLPITNPGLESIRAAQEPTPNSYLYYITGKNGIFYYAKTFDEHKVNIQKYLR